MMKYWYRNCPRCNQGRLFIMRQPDGTKLYFHCEECEWAWDDPKNIFDIGKGTLGIDLDLEYAEISTIQINGWTEFALNMDG